MNQESSLQVRPVEDHDLGDIISIDERITGKYRPDEWELRLGYYLRRDPDSSVVALLDGQVVGFMLGEVRGGEFGLDDPTAWIEVIGVDPLKRHHGIGGLMAEAMFVHFREQGAQSVRTLVDETMPGIAGFFSSLGFEPATLRPFARSL